MKPNNEGFFYPAIDKSKCISCNICEKACPIINRRNLYMTKTSLIKGIKWNGNYDEVIKSASAGIVYALSKEIIRREGIVLGAALIDGKVKHIIARTARELELTQNSKYVQSNTEYAFSELSKILNSDPEVLILFCGTPCQCAAFRNFMSYKKKKNVYIVDFVCHGVPSPLMLNRYFEWLKCQLGDNIKTYSFRCKHKGWNYNGYMSSYTSANGKVWSTQKDPYMVNFLNGNCYRESCYSCQFINEKGSDLTVGDFGGVKFISPQFFNKKGCSVVIENTDRGTELLKNILENCAYFDMDFNTVAKYNPHLENPSKRPNYRDIIYNGINEMNGVEFVNKNLKPSVRVKQIVKFYIPEAIKNLIKKLSQPAKNNNFVS